LKRRALRERRETFRIAAALSAVAGQELGVEPKLLDFSGGDGAGDVRLAGNCPSSSMHAGG